MLQNQVYLPAQVDMLLYLHAFALNCPVGALCSVECTDVFAPSFLIFKDIRMMNRRSTFIDLNALKRGVEDATRPDMASDVSIYSRYCRLEM